MGVRILYDREADQACLFCSTSGVAFGPVFSDGGAPNYQDADERAEAFCRWFQRDYEQGPIYRSDVRVVEDNLLQALYSLWLAQEAAQYLRENPPSCEHCGEPIGTCDADCPSLTVQAKL